MRLHNGTYIAADQVVTAVPPQDLERLGRSAPKVEPSPYIRSYLWFDRKLTGERFWALERLNTDFYDLSNIRLGWSERPSRAISSTATGHAR